MNQKVVEELWAIAAKAEAGEIVAVAISCVMADGGTGSTFVLGDALFSSLLGAIQITEHRMLLAGDAGPIE